MTGGRNSGGRRMLPWVGAAMAVVLATGAWFLLGGDDGDDGPAQVVTGGDAAAPAAPRDESAGRAEADPAPLAAAAPEAPVEVDPRPAMPAAYRAALGGITGRVVEEDGTPVPDIAVEIAGGDVTRFVTLLSRDAFLAAEPPEIDPVLAATVTDAEGRFRFRDLEPRTLGVLLVDPAGPRAHLHLLEETPVSAETRDLGDIVLPSSVTFSGRVVDARGEPVAGARVRATDLPSIGVATGVQDYRPGSVVAVLEGGEDPFVIRPPPALDRALERLPVPTTATDADGRFVLPGVPPGLISVVADDGVHVALVHGPVPSGPAGGRRDVGSLVLADGLSVAGAVEDDDGEPVADAEVHVGNRLALGPVALLNRATRTDAEGRFSVPGLRPGTVHAVARRDARAAFTLGPPASAGAEKLVVTLPAERVLTLGVWTVDPDTDERTPVADFDLFGRAVADDDVPDLFVPPQPWRDRVEPTGDEDDDRVLVRGLLPEQYEIVVRAQGRARERRMVDLRDGDAEVDVELPAGETVAVRVVRADDGVPLEYALVFAGGGDLPEAMTRTGQDGVARLRDLPPEEVELMATYPGLAAGKAEVDLSAPPEEAVEIALEAGGAIEGQVVMQDGRPPGRPLLVSLFVVGESEIDAIPRLTLTDLEGSFRFGQVGAGEALLQARERFAGAGTIAPWEMLFFESPLAEQEVEVTAGATTSVLLVAGAALADVDTGNLRGQLLVNGFPQGGWKVRGWGDRIRRVTETAADGSFDLGVVQAGEVTLSVSSPETAYTDGHTHRQTVQVGKDAYEYVELEIETGAIEGRVVAASSGRGLAAIPVTARPLSVDEDEEGEDADAPPAPPPGTGRANTLTGEDGSFTLGPLGAGHYEVEANGNADWADATAGVVEVRGRTPTRGVVLRMSDAVTVEGTVALQGVGETPSFLWLQAVREDGDGREWSRVSTEDGAYSLDGVSPGRWTFRLASDLDTDFEPVTHDVGPGGGRLDLVFVPLVEEPDAGG